MLTFAIALVTSLAQDQTPAHTVVRVADESTRLALRDVDADGDLDLLLVDEAGVHVRLLATNGTYSAQDDLVVAWPAQHLAWTLADLEGDGHTGLLMYLNGKEVRAYSLTEKSAQPSDPILTFPGSIPRGRFEMSFVRDVDADGRADLVLPGLGSYSLHLRETDGGWADPLSVRLETDVDFRLGDPRQLDSEFGQRVRIPWFKLEDVDGDGDVDLVARTEDVVFFHLAQPELSATPSWQLDLKGLRAELPASDGVDFSNLLGEAARRVGWEIVDLDGAAPNDLIVQIGGKFRVYLGGSIRGAQGDADQLLKASGNVLWFFLRDVQGDALPDLQLVRGEEISIGRIVRWLILPGALDFELFTYRNDGGILSKRPTRRNTLSLEIPRLLSFVKEMEELEEAQDEALPTRRFAFDPDALEDDVLDLGEGELLVWRNRAADIGGGVEGDDLDEILEELLFEDVDQLEDGETKTYNLREMAKTDLSPGKALRAACAGSDPDHRFPLAPGLSEATLHERDLNGDGRSDVLVIGRDEEEAWVVQFLVMGE